MVRKRSLTIDVTDEIEVIFNNVKKNTIRLRGEDAWKELDHAYIQRYIFSKIECWYAYLDRTEMTNSITLNVMNIILKDQ